MNDGALKLLSKLEEYYRQLQIDSIEPDRVSVLQPLIEYIQSQIRNAATIKLHFICTHNSRRSQFAQLWAQVSAFRCGVRVNTYSGGVEVTAFHPKAVSAAKRAGFHISSDKSDNPKYVVSYADQSEPLVMFSKLFNDKSCPASDFAAIMTCSHADETCPYIAGADLRIPITYEDPKAFDNTNLETAMYDARCRQIATEMKYVFSQINPL